MSDENKTTVSDSEVDFDADSIPDDEELTADDDAAPPGSLSQAEVDALLGGETEAGGGDLSHDEVDALLTHGADVDETAAYEAEMASDSDADETQTDEGDEEEPAALAQSEEEIDEIIKSWGSLVGRMINLDFPAGLTQTPETDQLPDLNEYNERDCRVLLGEIPIGMGQFIHNELQPTFVLKEPLTLSQDEFLNTSFPIEVGLKPVALSIEAADSIKAGSLIPWCGLSEIGTAYLTIDFFEIATGQLILNGEKFGIKISELNKPVKPTLGLDRPSIPARLVFGQTAKPFQEILQLGPGAIFPLDENYLAPFQLKASGQTWPVRMVKTSNGWSAQVLPDEVQLNQDRENYQRPLVKSNQKASPERFQQIAKQKPELTAMVLDDIVQSCFWDPGLVPTLLGLLNEEANKLIGIMKNPPQIPDSLGASDKEQVHRGLLVFQSAFNDKQNQVRLTTKLKASGLKGADENLNPVFDLYSLVNNCRVETLMQMILQLTPALASVLVNLLENPKRSIIVESLPDSLAVKIIKCIAFAWRAPDPAVSLVLAKKLNNPDYQDKNPIELQGLGDYTDRIGIQAAADLLGTLSDLTIVRTILDGLGDIDDELCGHIQSRMFFFEDIVLLDDLATQKLIQATDKNKWAMALKSVDAEVQEKVFRNMSDKATAMLREDMDFMGPVRLKDVEAAQKEITDTVKKLEERGDIVIARSGEDELVV